MDDKDFVFINRTPGAKEDKAFSEFLKSRREKILRTKRKKKAKKARIQAQLP